MASLAPRTHTPTPRVRVGRLNSDLNYTKDTKAFDASDIPAHVRVAVETVKATIDLDRLRTRPRPWNESVHCDQHKPYPAQVGFDDLKFEIRNGLRDERVTELKEKSVYVGVDTRNDYTRWNVSTETLSRDTNKAVLET